MDTSLEITGAGQKGHWATKPAPRILVTNKKGQAELIRQAYANHNPIIIGVDEMGHHGDAQAIADTTRRRVDMIATCHGETLTNVVNTETSWPVLGNIREVGLTRAASDVAALVRGVGRDVVHENIAQAVDEVLAGHEPRGLRIGNWPYLRSA